jgi:hypothetical protein
LEIGPGADPGSSDEIGVGPDVLEEPFLGQDLGAEHRLGIGVVVVEADADHGDENTVAAMTRPLIR